MNDEETGRQTSLGLAAGEMKTKRDADYFKRIIFSSLTKPSARITAK